MPPKKPATASKRSAASASDPSAQIDAFLAGVPEPFRSTLQSVRAMIRAAAPGATEAMSYGAPAFKLHGALVAYGPAKTHCSLYVMSPAVMEANRDVLEGYDTSKGTVRFPPDKPLPRSLVTKLVRARVAENNARAASRRKS